MVSTTYISVLTRGNSSNFSNLPVDDGKIRFIMDKEELYIDDSSKHIKISDLILGYDENEIRNLDEDDIFDNKIYISYDTKQLLLYDFNWHQWVNLIGNHSHSVSQIYDIGTSANYNVPASGDATNNEVVLGSDSRLSDARPASDVYDWAKVESKPSYNVTEIVNIGTAAERDIPTTGDATNNEVVLGSDSRLSDSRPASDVYDWAKAATKPSYNSTEVGAVSINVIGEPNGVAELDEHGHVLTSQLPGSVDEIKEGYLNKTNGKFYKESTYQTEIPGESDKIYLDVSTNIAYRWSGSEFVSISSDLALGETETTAYRGDRGKVAYTHATETKYTTSTAVGLYKVGSTSNGHISGLTAVSKSDITALGIPAQDTTYGVVSKTANGLVPQLPNETTTTKYLRQDGSWQVPPDNNTTYSAGNGLTLTGTSFNVGKRWNAVTQGQKWSRLYLATPVNLTEGTSGILAVSCTRGSTVCNATFLITTSHAGATYSNTIELASCNYTQIRSRIVVNSNGLYYFEIYDDKTSIAVGTTQTWHCCFIPLLDTTLTCYTTFTDGTTVPSGYTAGNDFTTTAGNTASAIKNITRSGTTFTATRQDGSTFTFTQQDSTYNFSGTTFYSGNSGTAEHNANNAVKNGNYYYTSNGPTTDIGVTSTDAALYVQSYSDAWVAQIAQDYRDGDLFVRGKNNGTWQQWKKILCYEDAVGFIYTPVTSFKFEPQQRKIITVKSTSAWDSQVYSRHGYTDNVYLTFKPAQTNMAIMIGLDSNPAQDANYTNIDYCWYVQNSGTAGIYESGSSIGSFGTYAVGDEFRIEYSGGKVRYYMNGALKREVARAYNKSTKLYMDSSMHGASSTLYDVDFGQFAYNATTVNGLTLSLVT